MIRILGIDFGEKRMGMALSDPLGFTAQGLCTYERKGERHDMDFIADLVEEYIITRIVIGMPRNMNGTYGESAEKVRNFGCLLQERLQIPMDYWDERLTTAAVQRVLIEADISRKKRKKVIDKLAAVAILQNYLDYQNNIKEAGKNGREYGE
jgi:putative holliday junction resolvase